MVRLLGLDLDLNRQSDTGNHATIWISDEFYARIDLLGDSKTVIKSKMGTWCRRAILETLQDRCVPKIDENGNKDPNFNPNKARKDMISISKYVDRGATLENFRQKKGSHPYANDTEMPNSLKSVIAGSIRCGDRLHAADIIDSDLCTHPECNSARHTTRHVFRECLRHAKRRKECNIQVDKILQHAHQHHGDIAVKNLKEVLADQTFQVTGICPDDMMAIAFDTRKRDVERVKENPPELHQMIDGITDNLTFEIEDGVQYATAYTDGSLLDPGVEHFQRAGWGFCVAPDHLANMSKPLNTMLPSVFRSELRAIMHAVQVCAIPTIVRSDCKSACSLVNKIYNGGGYDPRHPEADILAVIDGLKNKNCIVRWMPAHLDEEDNAKKLKKFLKAGGTQAHINGNCSVDALAKDGANSIYIDKTRHDMYRLRAWLTKTMQNFLVDVWRCEKKRMYNADIIDPNIQSEAQNIKDIEASQCEYDEMPHDSHDEEEDHEDDIFGNCDINGNEIDNLVGISSPKTGENEISFSWHSNRETVSDFVGVPCCGGGGAVASSSVFVSNIKTVSFICLILSTKKLARLSPRAI